MPTGQQYRRGRYEPCSIKAEISGEHSIIVGWQAGEYEAHTPVYEDFVHDTNARLGQGVEIIGAYAGINIRFAEEIVSDIESINAGTQAKHLRPATMRSDLAALILEEAKR